MLEIFFLILRLNIIKKNFFLNVQHLEKIFIEITTFNVVISIFCLDILIISRQESISRYK
jgi:hypothetical protein